MGLSACVHMLIKPFAVLWQQIMKLKVYVIAEADTSAQPVIAVNTIPGVRLNAVHINTPSLSLSVTFCCL